MKKPNFDGVKKYVQRGGTKCSTCSCSELAWIREAKAKGYSMSTIARYLTNECDFKISGHALAVHFREHEKTLNK